MPRKNTVKPLRDRVRLPVRLLFVGINPGVRSALSGHHFAGYSNRFWKLLYDSKLVPEPITYSDDDRLPAWGYGVTNLVPRPTPGIDTLRPDEYVAGLRVLRRKVRRWRPPVVAFVGVTAYRAVLREERLRPCAPKAEESLGRASALERAGGGAPAPVQKSPLQIGLQPETFEGARVFVLPNPSGRNANYSYTEMLDAFTVLRAFLDRRP
jgi:TDG/mug DNA glycosylase family protein